MFSHPLAQYSLLPNPQLLLLNQLLLPSQSTNKLKSQRVQKIRTEVLRRALAKLLRLRLLLPKNNSLQCMVKTRIYSQPLLKINRFSKHLLQILTPLVLLSSNLPTCSLLQESQQKVRWQPLNTQLCSRWVSKACSTGPSLIK